MLMPAIHISKKNFRRILNSDKPVLIDFWAPWCGPCRMQAPIIDELSDEIKGHAVVAKLDVDVHPELATQYSVMSIPTLLLLNKGKVVERRKGVTPKAKLLSMLNSAAP
jgi:thioredoxin 1